MRKILVAAAVLFATSCASAQPDGVCEKPDPTIRIFGPELTIDHLEKVGIAYAAKNPAVPQVPFATANRTWEQLKSQYKPGDVFRSFDGPRWSDGRPIAGGYILLRGNCVVGLMALWRS